MAPIIPQTAGGRTCPRATRRGALRRLSHACRSPRFEQPTSRTTREPPPYATSREAWRLPRPATVTIVLYGASRSCSSPLGYASCAWPKPPLSSSCFAGSNPLTEPFGLREERGITGHAAERRGRQGSKMTRLEVVLKRRERIELSRTMRAWIHLDPHGLLDSHSRSGKHLTNSRYPIHDPIMLLALRVSRPGLRECRRTGRPSSSVAPSYVVDR
jgi:hypothetical protein